MSSAGLGVALVAVAGYLALTCAPVAVAGGHSPQLRLSLVVTSTDVCSAEPITNGFVELTDGNASRMEALDREGRAEFWDVLPGDYIIYEQAPGHQPLGAAGQPPLRATISLDAPPEEVDLELAPFSMLPSGACPHASDVPD